MASRGGPKFRHVAGQSDHQSLTIDALADVDGCEASSLAGEDVTRIPLDVLDAPSDRHSDDGVCCLVDRDAHWMIRPSGRHRTPRMEISPSSRKRSRAASVASYSRFSYSSRWRRSRSRGSSRLRISSAIRAFSVADGIGRPPLVKPM